MSCGSLSPGQPIYKDRDQTENNDSVYPINRYDQSYEEPSSANPGFQATFSNRDSYSSHSTLSPQSYSNPHTPLQSQAFTMNPHLHESHLLHRASISGPVMESTYASGSEPVGAAPPRVHDLAAWENASGNARPHTADGMFGQFGSFLGGGSSAIDSANQIAADTSLSSSNGGCSSRPYTPASTSGIPFDPWAQQRRMSMPGSDLGVSGVGAGKIFSYMPPVDDGLLANGGLTYGSGYGSHLFGSLAGFNPSASKKRPRRRYDEIERLYPCEWPGCAKSYGTLNHLNAHVAMQKHGVKRSPTEFKDMRKAWRKQKKEEDQRRQSRHTTLTEQAIARGELVRPNSIAVGATSAGYSLAGLGLSPSGFPSATSLAPPPSLAGHPAIGLPAQLARYSMSSVSSPTSTATTAAAASISSVTNPFSYAPTIHHHNSHSAYSHPLNNVQHQQLHTATQGSGLVDSQSVRPVTAGGPQFATPTSSSHSHHHPHHSYHNQYSQNGLAYLAAHRGSI